jgi:two-component system LytT family response regulator
MPASDPIRVLVADDEAPMRMRLRSLLAEDDEIGCVLEAENGWQAVEVISSERPDIVFLDVQMPGLDGIQVIDRVGAENMPLTVFVTAYDKFAIQAFEAEAIDYLLKPFGNKRYETMLDRAKTRLRQIRTDRSSPTELPPASGLTNPGARAAQDEAWNWLAVKDRDVTRLVATPDIEWIEACGTYVTLHMKHQEILHRAPLSTMAARLDPRRFVRTHRSAIVNLDAIAILERRSHGEFDLVLKGGERVMLSRTYKPEFEALLGQPL